MDIKSIKSKLFGKSNIQKACRCIRQDGFKEFLIRAKRKLCAASKPLPGRNIWDNSLEQYQKGDCKLYWETLGEVQRYQSRQMTGDEGLNYLTYSLDYFRKHFKRAGLRALWTGCAEGNPGPEVTQFESGIFSRIEVMDIAEGLLFKQRKIAMDRGAAGIEYIKQDLNEVELEGNAYDLIFAQGTIHHIEKLERFFDQINNALKEHGKFIVREYIGPNRMQFTDTQLAIINEILRVLPNKYKKTMDGSIKNIAYSADLDWLMKTDPSESVRSQEIISVMKERLEIIKLAYTGGTILHPLLSDIASNFERDQDGEAILKLLILFEKVLTEKGVLPSDYVFCIAQKKLPVSSAQ